MSQLVTPSSSISEAEQEIRKIERELIIALQNIIIYRIKRSPNYPNYPSSLHQQYYQLVLAAQRKALELVHKEGIDYVGKKLKTDVYFSSKDIDLIKAQAEHATERFFNTVRRDAELTQQIEAKREALALEYGEFQRAAERRQQERERRRKQDAALIALMAAINRLVITAVTGAFARSILSKANQVPPKPVVKPLQPVIELRHKVMWVTQMDERVCPICEPLDGQVFYTEDATVPIPGDIGSLGSHPNCRCYFELVK